MDALAAFQSKFSAVWRCRNVDAEERHTPRIDLHSDSAQRRSARLRRRLTVSARELSAASAAIGQCAASTSTLRRGEVLGLLGPNGAGKTTTMQMLTGNLAPSTGSISICGVDLLERPTAAKARIGYLPEVPPLYKELTVNEYLRFAARLHRVPRELRRRKRSLAPGAAAVSRTLATA